MPELGGSTLPFHVHCLGARVGDWASPPRGVGREEGDAKQASSHGDHTGDP